MLEGKNNFFIYASAKVDHSYLDGEEVTFNSFLDREYMFDSSWSVALVEKQSGIKERHFITLNICENSLLNSKKFSLLGSYTNDEISNIFYIPLRKIESDKLIFTILNADLKVMKIGEVEGNIDLLLHFKRSLL